CRMFFFSRRLVFFAFGFAMWCGLPLPLLLLRDLLLAGDRLLRALAGPGVRVGPLAADRERPAVPDALVATDLDLALDVLGNLATEVPLTSIASSLATLQLILCVG